MWAIIGSLVLASPKEITPEWEKEVLGIHYTVTDVVHAIDELSEKTFDLENLEKAVQKESSGEYIEYWENGKVKLRIPYKNGKANGHVHGWYADGTDAFKGFFKDGVKQGIHITFSFPNKKSSFQHIRHLTFNEKGELDGEQFAESLETGAQAFPKYKNGKAQGFMEYWEGKEMTLSCYKDGKKLEPTPVRKNNKPLHRIDEDYVDEIIARCAKEAQLSYGVRACGSGAGMPFDVERIMIDFEVPGKGTVERARKMIIALSQKLADLVNQHEKIRPYLREYPFSVERAEVSLFFREGPVEHVLVGKNNTIVYLGETRFEEPYEEALKK